MKRGETLYLSPENKRLLGLPEEATLEEQRQALDEQCHHETDLDVNTYLFKLGTFKLVCVNPDGERDLRRGDHLCWYPKELAQERKCHFLAGGHSSDSPEYQLFVVKGYHADLYAFSKHIEKVGRSKKKLRLVG